MPASPTCTRSRLLPYYIAAVIIAAAFSLPALITPPAGSGNPALYTALFLVTVALNLLQYTMSDQFSFSLATVPELVAYYTFGPVAALLLILTSIITNTAYRLAARIAAPLEAAYKFLLNLSVFILALRAADAVSNLLSVDPSSTTDIWKFCLVVLAFGLVNNLLLVGIIRLAAGQWIFRMLSAVKIGYYIFFSFLFTPLIIYAYQDRGMLLTLWLIAALIPIQHISQSSHRLIEQEDALGHDSLTGLYNYHNLKERLTRLLEQQQPFAFALADLDGFKEINDTHGHVCGNEILKQFSRLFGKAGKPDGDLFRYGGDEFCLLTSSPESLSRVLERWEQIPLSYSWEGKTLSIGFSIGVLYYDGKEQQSFEAIISEADRRMYASKMERRSSHEPG